MNLPNVHTETRRRQTTQKLKLIDGIINYTKYCGSKYYVHANVYDKLLTKTKESCPTV